ncbi:MAG: PIN domain-containing protein [Deltaproteobacteria bacterium]|jgi:predicted nucleic acid-binding protein|nr:PIN domain-containing protein [Deltaproteobacteria bacterium]
MKNSVLVDTSIWIAYFNQPESKYGAALEKLIIEDQAVYAGIVLAELLQGAKVEKEFNQIQKNFNVLPYLETYQKIWLAVGVLSYSLRKKGITLPISDIILACLAQENNCRIFSLDQHFEMIPKISMFQV